VPRHVIKKMMMSVGCASCSPEVDQSSAHSVGSVRDFRANGHGSHHQLLGRLRSRVPSIATCLVLYDTPSMASLQICRPRVRVVE
jgi:hypothetical protein